MRKNGGEMYGNLSAWNAKMNIINHKVVMDLEEHDFNTLERAPRMRAMAFELKAMAEDHDDLMVKRRWLHEAYTCISFTSNW